MGPRLPAEPRAGVHVIIGCICSGFSTDSSDGKKRKRIEATLMRSTCVVFERA
eukprot:jgi/Botrbrau1/22616/Bobra.176_1s0046.1